MTNELAERIAAVQRMLPDTLNARVEIGKLNPPAVDAVIPALPATLAPYGEFLRVVNGAECGPMYLFSAEKITGRQFYVAEMPGGNDTWYCIGSLIDQAILVNTISGLVHWYFPPTNVAYDDYLANPSRPEYQYGSIDHFLTTYVFGAGYADLDPESTESGWYRLLEDCGLV